MLGCVCWSKQDEIVTPGGATNTNPHSNATHILHRHAHHPKTTTNPGDGIQSPLQHYINSNSAQYDDRPIDHLLVDNQLNNIDTIIHGNDAPAVTQYDHTPLNYRSTLNEIWLYTVTEQWEDNIPYRQLYDMVRHTALHNYIAAWRPVKSDFNVPAWRSKLADYHDTALIDMLEYGWPADYTAPPGHPYRPSPTTTR